MCSLNRITVILLAGLIMAFPVLGFEMMFKTFDGYDFVMEVDEKSSIAAVKNEIEPLFGVSSDEIRLYADGRELKNQENVIDYQSEDIWVELGEEDVSFHAKSIERDYRIPLSASEKKDISFIVKTLAYKPLTKIWKYKGSLEYAGERVQHVHPLNFLYMIFGNEELKVCIRNIRKRGWVWGDFFNGLKNSLKEESSKGNLTEGQLENFAGKLEIDLTPIYPEIQNGNWLEFTDFLIDNVQREGDTGRYGM